MFGQKWGGVDGMSDVSDVGSDQDDLEIVLNGGVRPWLLLLLILIWRKLSNYPGKVFKLFGTVRFGENRALANLNYWFRSHPVNPNLFLPIDTQLHTFQVTCKYSAT